MSTYISDILSLVFGNISVVINVAIGLPQLISVAKTKNTSGTSLSSYIIFALCGLSWLLWAIMNYVANVSYLENNPDARLFLPLHIASLIPAVISNLITASMSFAILFYKIKYLRGAKRLKLTELQYSQIVFDNHKNESWIRKYSSIFIICAGILLLCGVSVLTICLIGVPKQISYELFDKLTWAVFIINIIAAVFNESISWPQFVKCVKTKDTSGISLGWCISLLLSCVVCVAYDAFLAKSFGIWNVLASLIFNGVIVNTLVLILKLKNHFAAKKLGISEWKYTKKYIAPKSKNK